MLPIFKKNAFPHGFASLAGSRLNAWGFHERGYYDLTPPSEVSEPELDADDGQHDDSPRDGTRIDEPLVAVIGVGYVGEHLVNAFSKQFRVLGYDVSKERVKKLESAFAANTQVQFTSSAYELATATHYLVSVPTLLLPDKSIDSSFLRSALTAVAKNARRGSVVVIESSVAVGMTREFLGPLAKDRGFFAGMSPERVDPGRTDPPAHAIPKVISGLDDVVPGSLEAIRALYSRVFERVVLVSSPEVAEMTKLYENCQRMVCIAYANEMADACQKLKIDPFEVCEAASTKPFGFLPFQPSLGVGGHCIPINPYYLIANNDFPLLESATERMRNRPAVIAQRAIRRLSGISWPRVLVVGMGFKPGQSHLANSPGLELTYPTASCNAPRHATDCVRGHDKCQVSWRRTAIQHAAVRAVNKMARLFMMLQKEPSSGDGSGARCCTMTECEKASDEAMRKQSR
ncbi:hypothetical protein HIM_04235 [Hirsutella minnesotensis 3608]|uniref:UDP-glucose/GDP-mannose dehydrogenase C-terminal domain-containing protein n=1 Tax=Hirsutella minnesotensis 3608 TaxID=1043627 RepID=A0A0F7ZLK6_9HYPO|nr:hypothetical protein HIM_04235 [Hirsutella minnesotensis 3608]